MSNTLPTLFSSFSVGNIQLKNRIVMAPMTRSRAIGNIPNDLMADYYADRADAGLIITEGTAPSPNGLGYSRIPGMFSAEQSAGWKLVTDAVHAKGGKIVLQLMHVGRIGHPLNLPAGAKLVSASAIAAKGQMWTDQEGMKDQPTPQEIPTAEIAATIGEYVAAAKAAINAEFDGVELHAANGYLPNQFLNPASNQRSDEYGGSAANRNRFVLELAKEVSEAIGRDKTGIRMSPFNPFNDMSAEYEGQSEQYAALAGDLSPYVSYLHYLAFALPDDLLKSIRAAYDGPIMLNGGYTAERAEADLASGKADLISFGTPFIANPDFVYRVENDEALATADQATFYTPGPAGYTDYPKVAGA